MSGRIFWLLYLGLFLTGNVKVGGLIYLNHILFAFLLLIGLVDRTMHGSLPLPRNMTYLFLIFLVPIVVSLYVNDNTMAIKNLIQLVIFYSAIFFPYLAKPSLEWVGKLHKYSLIGCTFNAVVGVYQSYDWIHRNGFVFLSGGKFFRIQGLSASPMDYVMTIMVGFCLALKVERPKLRAVAISFYVVMLLTSMSRSGLIVLFVIGALYALSSLANMKRLLVFATCLIAFVGFLGAVGALELVTKRISDIGNIGYNIKRLITYQDVISKSTVDIHTFLFGNGFGTYLFLHPVDYSWYDNPHNIYLYILYSAGVVGFVVFFSAMAYLVLKAFSAFSDHSLGETWTRAIAAVLLVHLCTWIVGLVETNVNGVGTGWLLGILFGIPLLLKNWEREECIS